MDIRRLDSQHEGFQHELEGLLAWESVSDDKVFDTVNEILRAVRRNGDSALLEYSRRFDELDVASVADLEIPMERLQMACERIDQRELEALKQAADRIRSYAQHQKLESWQYTEADGTLLGQQVSALDRVGLYVPGGKAAYPSSVLMNAIPASVAGVRELVMVVPTPRGIINEMVLAAAHIAGVNRVFTIGGAQAVAALAYGTESVPAVDKIVGPGNIYVVGIDMIAGPSEILVICDGATDPDWIAMDLFSQAEHDEDAQAILLSPDGEFLDRVAASMARLIAEMPRKQIIDESLSARGALIKVRDLDAMRSRSLITSRPSISNSPWKTRSRWPNRFAMPAQFFSGAIPPRRSATTAPDPITCCRRRAPRASRHRSVFTISRSVPA